MFSAASLVSFRSKATPHREPRSRSISGVAIFVLSGLLGACATGSTPRSDALSLPQRFDILYRENGSESRDILEAPIDSIWKLLPGVYRETGFPAAPSSRGKALIYFTPHLEIPTGKTFYPGERTSDYIDCGKSPTAGARSDNYAVTFIIMTRLTPVDDSHTLVQTLLDGHARPRGFSGNSVPCHGTGKLEQQISDGLRKRANLPRRATGLD